MNPINKLVVNMMGDNTPKVKTKEEQDAEAMQNEVQVLGAYKKLLEDATTFGMKWGYCFANVKGAKPDIVAKDYNDFSRKIFEFIVHPVTSKGKQFTGSDINDANSRYITAQIVIPSHANDGGFGWNRAKRHIVAIEKAGA